MSFDLGRYERMAQRTKLRLKNEQVRDYVESGAPQLVADLTYAAQQEIQSYDSDQFRDGPPGNCHTCYSWSPHFKFRTIAWHHGALIDHIVRDVVDEEYPEEGPYPVDVCRCPCHGSDGMEFPRVALASA